MMFSEKKLHEFIKRDAFCLKEPILPRAKPQPCPAWIGYFGWALTAVSAIGLYYGGSIALKEALDERKKRQEMGR